MMPVVTWGERSAVAKEITEGTDCLYAMLLRLERENPAVFDFLAKFSHRKPDAGAILAAGLTVYRMLELATRREETP